jgi:hypothetical protein
MKFDIRFATPPGIHFRCLQFRGKGHAYLDEMALVLEGPMPKFTLPLISRFYYRLLYEQATRTIPYSRIVAYRYSGDWVCVTPWRVLLAMLLAAPFTLVVATSREYLTWEWWAVVSVAGAFLIGLLFVVGRRQHGLTYRQMDGKLCNVALSNVRRPRERAREFRTRLGEHVDFTRSYQGKKP